MATAQTIDWTTLPYAEWLETCISELVKATPVAIAMEMVGVDGNVLTCYYNTSPKDRACMIDAMRDDARFEFIKNNADEILAMLNGEDDEEECENDDVEDDSEGG